MKLLFLLGGLCVFAGRVLATEVVGDATAVKARLQGATTKHLDQLLGASGVVPMLKGKAADGEEALAFYRMFEVTGNARYRTAALTLVERILKEMRATKFGVLPIKEKEKGDGKKFIGGGPPALGFYTANVAYILHKEGGRAEDLKYLGKVLDDFPWNEKGWWSQDIDVVTGEPKEEMDKPSIINKCAAVAMATGMLAEALREVAPELAARLKQKTDKCVYEQIIPTQLEDGFWHYNLSGKDPKDKDILGYFMLTTRELMELQHFNAAYREPKLDATIRKAQTFALKCIAPMCDPNSGPPCAAHSTPGTPKH
ncbi:MAG TPA: hypothetical protein VK968_05115, partial [Roseimicrobium sp.]|nr:hypothetical protein [Roseimicrobium sp.]